MSADHQQMVEFLKELVIPALRERGFKGSFPHFRRIGSLKTDLFSFQFDKWGGGFFVELGEGPKDELIQPWGKVAANKLNTSLLPLSQRVRLSAESNKETETGFRFDGRNHAAFANAANQVLALLPQADGWWQGERTQPNICPFT